MDITLVTLLVKVMGTDTEEKSLLCPINVMKTIIN